MVSLVDNFPGREEDVEVLGDIGLGELLGKQIQIGSYSEGVLQSIYGPFAATGLAKKFMEGQGKYISLYKKIFPITPVDPMYESAGGNR